MKNTLPVDASADCTGQAECEWDADVSWALCVLFTVWFKQVANSKWSIRWHCWDSRKKPNWIWTWVVVLSGCSCGSFTMQTRWSGNRVWWRWNGDHRFTYSNGRNCQVAYRSQTVGCGWNRSWAGCGTNPCSQGTCATHCRPSHETQCDAPPIPWLVRALYRGQSTRLATFANRPFFNSGTDVSIGPHLPEPSRWHRHPDSDELPAPSPLVPPSCSVVTKDQQTTLCKRLRHSWISWDSRRSVCEPMVNRPRVLQIRQSWLQETKRHSWKRRHATRFLRWVLLNTAIAVSKVRSDACGSLSRSQQTSPLVSRTTSSSVSADVRVGSSRDFTCRLMASLLTSDSKENPTVESWQSSESKSTWRIPSRAMPRLTIAGLDRWPG